MKESVKVGLFFGVTSGIITTLGIIVGLSIGTGLKSAVIGGILTIAIADALSDALGIHVSQEASKRNSKKSVWESTIITFAGKFTTALLFLIPVIFLELDVAVKASIALAIFLLIIFNYKIAKYRKERPINVIAEHVLIAIIVIALTHLIGKLISSMF